LLNPERESAWKALDWQLIPETRLEPVMNMALDEVLSERVGSGDRKPTLRIWGWTSPCVVLGRFQSVRNEVDEDEAERFGIQIVRRISGGGAMFIEPEGAITWSIYAPTELAAGMSFPASYAMFDDWAVEALRSLGIDAFYAPLNDITSTNGKIGGAAQSRRGGTILHHTTMAYDMNTDLMSRVLRVGREKLSDKGVASADKRVGPLRRQTNLTRTDIIAHLVSHFSSQFGLMPDALGEEEMSDARDRIAARFGTKAWTHYLP
jgi:lipoate-protein ligase A